jgi:hypothetical protein
LNNKYFLNVESEAQQSISIMARTVSLAEEQKQEALVKELTNRFNAVEVLYRNKVGYGEQ